MKKEVSENAIYEKDVVLIHMNKFPFCFARIDSINPADKRGWYNVSLTKLSVPLEHMNWTLDETHLNCEQFSMNGVPFQFQKVPAKVYPENPEKKEETKKETFIEKREGNVVHLSKIEKPVEKMKTSAKVISLLDRIKKQPGQIDPEVA